MDILIPETGTRINVFLGDEPGSALEILEEVTKALRQIENGEAEEVDFEDSGGRKATFVDLSSKTKG